MSDTRRASIVMTAGDQGPVISLEGVFVSIDLDKDIAYVSYEVESGIRWDELPRADAELMVRLGARAAIDLGSRQHVARRSA